MADNFPDALLESFQAFDKYKEEETRDSLVQFFESFQEARKMFQSRQWRKHKMPDGGVYMRPIPLGEETE